ncbi:MAG TPA: hypothetical protein VIG30_13040 [Ktedonobacterales bacterium]|jgi:hypothetical protein
MDTSLHGGCHFTARFTCPDRHSEVMPHDETATVALVKPLLRARLAARVELRGDIDVRVTHLPEAEVGCYEARGGWVTSIQINAHCAVAAAHLTPHGLLALRDQLEADLSVGLNQFFGFVQVDEVFLVPDAAGAVMSPLPVR